MIALYSPTFAEVRDRAIRAAGRLNAAEAEYRASGSAPWSGADLLATSKAFGLALHDLADLDAVAAAHLEAATVLPLPAARTVLRLPVVPGRALVGLPPHGGQTA